MNQKLLEKLGMTAREVKLYLKLLELGSSPANNLSRRLEENRTSTYSLLQSLQKKGFVTYSLKRNVKYFYPIDPGILVDQYVHTANNLQSALPELLAVFNKSTNKPRIAFYEGVNGIKQLCETLLEVPGSTRFSFMGVDESTIHPEIKEYFETDFLNRRVAADIKYKAIVTGLIPFASGYKKTHEAQLRELKWVDPKKFPMNIQIDIYPHNKVAIYSYNKDEMMGIVIEHESFYSTMRSVFQIAWSGL